MTPYVLGICAADGSTHEHTTIYGEKRYSCDLEMAEEQIISDIAKLFHKDVFYRERIIRDKVRRFWKVHFSPEEMILYGPYLMPGRPGIYDLYKSFDDAGQIDFVRGLFDGDGTICQRKNGTSVIGFSINSSCDGIRKILEDFFFLFGFSLSKYFDKRGSGSWFYSINSKKDKVEFAKLIYKNCEICLNRKRDKFMEIFGSELIA